MSIQNFLSLRARLVLLVVAAVFCAQAVLGCLLLWQETQRYAAMKREAMLAAAQSLAAGLAPAAAKANALEIRTVLRAIGRIPGLVYAAVDDVRGNELADLGATERLAGDLVFDPVSTASVPLMQLIGSRTAEMTVPLISGGLPAGQLRIVSDTADLAPRLMSALMTTFYASLLALAIGVAVALKLQGSISRPLRELTATMARVGTHHDYSVAIESARRDEIGVLARGFAAMLGDIRVRDAKLARHREQLETEVADRTRDYREARDAAESASHAKSDFLATMSHEIRTPMNGILVMADLLAAGDLPQRSRRYAEVIARSGKGLLAIINDILDFSKIEAGKLEVEILSVDAGDAAQNAVNLFGERAQGKGLDLAAIVDPGVPPGVLADPVRLNQVLANLINNALKFTEQGHVQVHVAREGAGVRFSVRDTGIGIAPDKISTIFGAFSQADQTTTRRFGGTGLGLSIARRLVAAMGGEIRVESTLGEGSTFSFCLPEEGGLAASPWPQLAGGGTALVCISGAASAQALSVYLSAAGLQPLICTPDELSALAPQARLVAASAAALQAAGSRVAPAQVPVIALARLGETGIDSLQARHLADAGFDLPLARSDVLDMLSVLARGEVFRHTGSAQRQEAGVTQYPAARVLVVDDGAVNREVAQEALRRFGIAAELVCDGRAAVEACAQGRFDLVLMDGSMPVLDGFEATRAIREAETREGRARQTIVAMTAHVVGEAAEAWRTSGMDGVLHKPVTIATMAGILERFIAGAASGADKPVADSAPENEDAGVLDLALVAQLREMAAAGRGDFVQRVTGLYAEHAPKALEEARAAQDAGDAEALGRAVHALKSMSLNVGAHRVSALAAQIEARARSGEVAAASEIAALAVAVDAARASLHDLAAAA